jgi:hypothetical protein
MLSKHKYNNEADQMALARESLAIQMRSCNKHDVWSKYIVLKVSLRRFTAETLKCSPYRRTFDHLAALAGHMTVKDTTSSYLCRVHNCKNTTLPYTHALLFS